MMRKIPLLLSLFVLSTLPLAINFVLAGPVVASVYTETFEYVSFDGSGATAPRISVTADRSGEDTFRLYFELDDPSAIAYYGMELTFDADRLEFMSGSVGEAMQPGFTIAQPLFVNRIGASVTRYGEYSGTEGGVLMVLDFRIRNPYVETITELEVRSLSAANALGEGVAITYSSTIEIEMDAAEETENGDEGSSGDGGSDGDDGGDDGEGSDGDSGGSPGQGSGGDGSSNGGSGGSGSGGDEQGGGTGGEGDSGGSSGGDQGDEGGSGGEPDADPDPDMDIVIVHHDIVQYYFDLDLPVVSRSSASNRGKVVELVGGTFTFVNATGLNNQKALRATGWNGREDGSKYWMTTLNTIGFRDIQISWIQWGSNTGPRDFRLEARIPGLNAQWETIPESQVRLSTTFNINNPFIVPLPEWMWNQHIIEIRWVMDSDYRIAAGSDGEKLPVSSAGTNNLASVRVYGYATEEEVIQVRFGDTNNDGVVDESDVLPLGYYWMSSGPVSTDQSFSWNRKARQAFVPAMATYADANGDGRVDYRDLQLIGLHFGKGHDANRPKTVPVQEFSVDYTRLLSGQVDYHLHIPVTDPGKKIVGISGMISLREGLRVQIAPAVCEIATLFDDHETIKWERREGNRVAFAWSLTQFKSGNIVCKNEIPSSETLTLLNLEVMMDGEDWPVMGQEPDLPDVIIERLSVIYDTGVVVRVHEAVLVDPGVTSVPSRADQPASFRLYPVYPNPFNPVTNIRWLMDQPANVEITVYDILGRQQVVLVDRWYPSGTHSVSFDASRFSSGTYLVRVRSGSYQQLRKVMLVK